jgi:ketosteroid isomerase-like protein
MICGIALIGYGVIAPAVTLFRTVASGLRTIGVTPLRTTATAPATPTAPATTKVKGQKVKGQDEIMKMYAKWKNAWKDRDLDGLLKLYSPRAQFRLYIGPYAEGYTGMKEELGGLVGTGYTVVDRETPSLSIAGDRATLLAAQSYLPTPESPAGLNYNHRFVLEQHEVENNNLPPGNARQWRIVKSEFTTFQRLEENSEEIY